MMRYFSIGSTHDLEVIRHYPQTSLRDGYNPTLKNSSRNVKYSEFPDFSPELELEIHPEAIATNFLERTDATFGMIIDSDIKNILGQFKLPPHHFYPIKVYHKGKLLTYFWFHHIIQNIWEYIDIDRSLIRIQNATNLNNKVVIPLIKKEYLEQLHDYFFLDYEFNLMAEEIILNKNFENLDLVDINFLYGDLLISHRLKDALEKAGLTGFETKLYKPLNAPHYIA